MAKREEFQTKHDATFFPEVIHTDILQLREISEHLIFLQKGIQFYFNTPVVEESTRQLFIDVTTDVKLQDTDKSTNFQVITEMSEVVERIIQSLENEQPQNEKFIQNYTKWLTAFRTALRILSGEESRPNQVQDDTQIDKHLQRDILPQYPEAKRTFGNIIDRFLGGTKKS